LGVDAAVVLPPLGRWDPPGVCGLGTGALQRRGRAAVVTNETLIVVDTTDLTLRPIGGLDPAIGLVEVSGDGLSPGTHPASWATAGRSARTVARHCQQVLAGIGFTAEHPFHRYLRRTLVLDGLLGDSRSLTKQLGDDLLRTRELPPLPPL